jgi:membrane associated rhomboid family serine protease
MPSLTPLIKRLLILWGVLWLASFITATNGRGGVSDILALYPIGSDFFDFEAWRVIGVVSYAFVHDAGSILHVAINAYLMAVFGPEVEVLYPGKRFLKFLLVATLAGAAAHSLLSLMDSGIPPVVGGSGLVSAVIAVNAAVYPGRILNLIILRCRMITFFLVLMGLDLLRTIAFLKNEGTQGVAFDVHLAGAFAGWMWAGGFERFDNPYARWVERRRRQAASSKQQRARQAEVELDRILAKIGKDGMPSLTAAERRFLEKRSADRKRKGGS